MPQVTIPTSLSNAQREELLGAITLRSGGKIHLAEPNYNRFSFERPSLPLHIYQGNEDILSFARESNIDLLSMEPQETKLGAVQHIADASAFVNITHQWMISHQNSRYSDQQTFITGLAAELAKKLHSNSSFSLPELMLGFIEKSPSLLADVKMITAFPDHAEVIERLPQQLWQSLSKAGYRLTLDREVLKPAPSQGVSIVSTQTGDVLKISRENPQFNTTVKKLLEKQVQEKVFIQALHQIAAQNGTAIEVVSQEYASAYPVTMLRPSSMATLRQIYAAKQGAELDRLLSKVVFVHKPVLAGGAPVSVQDEAQALFKRQSMELLTMFYDGLQRAKFQQAPDVQLEKYGVAFDRVRKVLLDDGQNFDTRNNALDMLRDFVVNGGLYSPESKRDELFYRTTATISRTLFEQPGDAASISDANRKQVAWRAAYDALLENVPVEYRNEFAEAVEIHWGIVCPNGEFPRDQLIPEMAKNYAKLLKDLPAQLNRNIGKSIQGMIQDATIASTQLHNYSDVLGRHPAIADEVNAQLRALSDTASSFSAIKLDEKPADLYNMLKSNIDVLRLCSVQYEKAIGFSREALAEAILLAREAQRKAPLRLDIEKSKVVDVPEAFVETLRRVIDACENSSPQALTVQEFVDILSESFNEEVSLEDIALPAGFSIENALVTMQSSGALAIVESIDARKRQRDEEAEALLRLKQVSQSGVGGSLPEHATPEDNARYNGMMQEVSYLTSSLEAVLVETQPELNELTRRRNIRNLNEKIEAQWQKIKKFEAEMSAKEPELKMDFATGPFAHETLRDVWVMSKLLENPYSEAVKAEPELYTAQKAEFEQAWVEQLKERAQNSKLDDAILDDYVAHYGITVMQSVFRGIYEQGVAGYIPLLERNRVPDATEIAHEHVINDQKTPDGDELVVETELSSLPADNIHQEPLQDLTVDVQLPTVANDTEIVQFSDHSDLSDDPLKRPVMLEADALLEEASTYMYKDNELILADEEAFLMNAFDRLFGDDSQSVEQLQNNAEELKHLVSPIEGVKARARINDWYLHAYDVQEVSEKIALQTEEIRKLKFPDVKDDFRHLALLSPSFREVSAGANMFILQSTSESVLTRLKSSFKEEVLSALQGLSLKKPGDISEWLADFRSYQQLRTDIRRFAQSAPECDKVAGQCWSAGIMGKPFGTTLLSKAVADLKNLLSDGAAVSVLLEQMSQQPDVKGYLVLSAENPEIVEQPVKKQRASRGRSSDLDFSDPEYADDESALSLHESVSVGRVRI